MSAAEANSTLVKIYSHAQYFCDHQNVNNDHGVPAWCLANANDNIFSARQNSYIHLFQNLWHGVVGPHWFKMNLRSQISLVGSWLRLGPMGQKQDGNRQPSCSAGGLGCARQGPMCRKVAPNWEATQSGFSNTRMCFPGNHGLHGARGDRAEATWEALGELQLRPRISHWGGEWWASCA